MLNAPQNSIENYCLLKIAGKLFLPIIQRTTNAFVDYIFFFVICTSELI